MIIRTHPESNATVVALSGRLDTVTQSEYEEKIRALIESGHLRLVVDFEELVYISSAGLRVMIVMGKLLKEKDGRVCLATVKNNVRSVFDMSGMSALFRMEDSVPAALAALG